MGLAGTKNRQKIGFDPNNTRWSRDETTFGQKILRAHGWAPGQVLGSKDASHAEYHTAGSFAPIKVELKDDTLGLGAKPRQKQSDECTGLNSFNDLLGRLNGKSNETIASEQKVRNEFKTNLYIERRFGTVRFVSGGLLVGDQMKDLIDQNKAKESAEGGDSDDQSEQPKVSKKEKKSKKRKADEITEVEAAGSSGEEKKKKKKSKSSKRARDEDSASDVEAEESAKSKKKKSKKAKNEDDAGEEDSVKPTSKKEKKKSEKSQSEGEAADEESAKQRKKDKKSKKSKEDPEAAEDEKSERKRRKEEKKRKKLEKSEASKTTQAAKKPDAGESGTSTPNAGQPLSRHHVRARNIASKRSAMADMHALNQILMIKAV